MSAALGLWVALVFVLGAAIGSFVNVLVYRMPLGLSVVRPASRCPACDTPVALRHNIPILGWLILRGRCAQCRVGISARYPLVELTLGLLAVALFVGFLPNAFGATHADPRFVFRVLAPTLLCLVFVGALVANALIDLDWFILPNELTLPLIPLGIMTAWAVGPSTGVTPLDAAIGAAAGALVLLVILVLYGLLTGRSGMGGGDWKLLGAIGAYLGATALPFVLFAAALQGLVLAILLRRSFAVAELPPDPADLLASAVADAPPPAPAASETPVPFRQLAVPFGPFLALAAVEYLLFRDEIRRVVDVLFPAGG